MFNSTTGPAREVLSFQVAENLRKQGSLIIDEGRTRPQYFDGRFLTAQDLTREQNYFLSRQADLGQASGGGIVHGLLVEPGPSAGSITIRPGHGITAAGELVLLPDALTFNLADVAEIQQLDAIFGLARIPAEPLRTRSGLFIVALRPVEFTDHPIASYPTSITGPRTVEDSDIVEAVAITLIPYVDRSGDANFDQRRAAVARELFLAFGRRGVPDNVLPLAMIAIERGVVRWVDPYLVRREVGAVQTSFFGLGQAPRALREAHLLQYQQHLAEVLRERGEGARFTAAEVFRALPPAGPMPFGAVNTNDFSQIYFPIEVDVQLTIIPADELAAIIEDSLPLPPIDLTLSDDDLESTSVLVMAPVARQDWQAIRGTLTQIERTLKPPVPGLVAIRRPIQALQLLKPGALVPVINPGDINDRNWQDAFLKIVPLLGGFRTLWYARRRNAQIAQQASATAPVPKNVREIKTIAVERMKALGVQGAVKRLQTRADEEATASLDVLLSSPKLSDSKVLVEAAVAELGQAKALNQRAVSKVAARFDHPRMGEGLRRLEDALPDLKKNARLIKRIAESGRVPELDRMVRLMPEEELASFAKELSAAAKAKDEKKLHTLLESRIKKMP